MRLNEQQRMEEKKLGIVSNNDNPVMPAYPSAPAAEAVPVKTSAAATRNPFKQ